MLSPSIPNQVLSTFYYHVGLEELSVKEFELTLERDPTSDSYTLFARDSFLDPIRKDPAFIQFMTEMKTRWEGYRREFG